MKKRPLFVALLLFCVLPAAADVPLPGNHSASPKYWAAAQRWVTNFSPYAFNGPVSNIVPDGRGGVWFGLGQTVEHISRSGAMQNFAVSQEWLWRIWSLAKEPSGTIWFSIGQSGRIGTLDERGRVRTLVLVPRKFFPDIRKIAFAQDGSLWFQDLGRRSVGRRASDGSVKEIPVPDGSDPYDLEYCNGSAWVASRGSTSDAIYRIDSHLRGMVRVRDWDHYGSSSLACDARGVLWYAHTGYLTYPVEGYVDRGHVHESASTLQYVQVVPNPERGTIWLGGVRSVGTLNGPGDSRLTLIERNGTRTVQSFTIPILASQFVGSLTATPDGMIWIGLDYAYSIVRLSPRR